MLEHFFSYLKYFKPKVQKSKSHPTLDFNPLEAHFYETLHNSLFCFYEQIPVVVRSKIEKKNFITYTLRTTLK